MALTVTQLAPAIGAEISGLDLHGPFDAATTEALNQALNEHIVLVFHDQDLDEASQIAFSGLFGKVGERARPVERRPEGADYDGALMLVSNVRDEAGEYIGSLPDGELWWHHDMSYVAEPHKATVLHALEVPSSGGNTKYSNMYAAYDNLPRALKDKLAGRNVLQVYDYHMTIPVDIDQDYSHIRHYTQPIFITHPDTGRTALYVSRLMSARIDGMDRAESDAILQDLFGYAEDPAVVYEHQWRVGDVLMWDNYCSIHARTDFPESEIRKLRRCTVEGGVAMTAAA